MAEEEKYLVRLDNFEGPLDLLLHLLESNKMDIYDIPIADITKQYLAYLGRRRGNESGNCQRVFGDGGAFNQYQG